MLIRRGRRFVAALLTGALLLAAAGPAHAAECAGDECQGPPPAPEEVIPGTAVVEGPQNPPAHFPGHHHKKPGARKHHAKKHPRHRVRRGPGS